MPAPDTPHPAARAATLRSAELAYTPDIMRREPAAYASPQTGDDTALAPPPEDEGGSGDKEEKLECSDGSRTCGPFSGIDCCEPLKCFYGIMSKAGWWCVRPDFEIELYLRMPK